MTLANENPDILRRGLQRELPCPLTDAERLQRAIEAARRRGGRAELETALERAKAEAKEAIAADESKIERLDVAVRDGVEKRLVTCHERFHAGTVEIVRDDTGEVIETRHATMAEAQRSLPGADQAPDDVAGDDSDGTGVVRASDGERLGAVVASSTGGAVFVGDGDDGESNAPPAKKRGKAKVH